MSYLSNDFLEKSLQKNRTASVQAQKAHSELR
jgi:hypothetical protein